MNDETFRELLSSIRQAKAIEQGTLAPGRVTKATRDARAKLTRQVVAPKAGAHRAPKRATRSVTELNVQAIRTRLHLSQPKFAELLGISVRTLEGWEQGRRQPAGPARVLLRVADKHPEAVLDVVRG